METPLRRLRREAGMKQSDLAQELGVSRQQVAKLEAQQDMLARTAVKVAHVLAPRLGRRPEKVLAELTQVNEKKQPVTAA